jgi:ParB-like chromosome segregation protein Spo0J
MAKLDTLSTAGFNAGKNFYANIMRLNDIVIDPEISRIFKINVVIRDEILQKIRDFGYDKNQPIVVWKGHGILVDGHTRYSASKEAGLDEIYVTEKEFATREEAIFYAFERQVLRRNLSPREILKAVKMLPEERNAKGQGSAAVLLAQKLGISPSTVYQAKRALKESPEEDIQAIMDDKLSIKGANAKLVNANKEFVTNDAVGLPPSVKFLKGAVILLIEANEKHAANLLINHFLKKHERDGFNKLLPDSVREALYGENGLAVLA